MSEPVPLFPFHVESWDFTSTARFHSQFTEVTEARRSTRRKRAEEAAVENASLRPPLAARAVTLHPATGFTAPETGARGGSLTRVGQRSGAIIIYDSAKSRSLRERITDFLILRWPDWGHGE